MSAQIGLYFPYFHFPNDEWVKVAALYWDKIFRIVPYGYNTKRDTEVVKQLADERLAPEMRFIDNLRPEDFYEDLNDIKIAFLKLIETHTDELVKYYGIANRDNWAVNPYTARYAPEADHKLAYIYSEKFEHELRGILIARGLGTTRSHEGPDYQWIGMHPRLANVYMAALAERLAVSTQTHPITEDNINYFAIEGFTFERLSQILLENARIASPEYTEDEFESRLATIAIRAVMPKDIKNISLEKIMALRGKHAGEFGKFQEFVQNVVSKLPGLKEIDAPAFVNDHLNAEFKKVIKPRLDELDDSIKSIGIETIPTILNLEVKVPSLLAGAGLIGGATLINPTLGATAAVAIGILKIIGDKRKAITAEIKKSDVSFLMHVRDDLTPADSLKWLNIQSRKLIFGT